jgi:hypothetical protein
VTSARQIGVIPAPFAAAMRDLDGFAWDRRIQVAPLDPPGHIAPYSAAVNADITLGTDFVATGRLILLYDPRGNDIWRGEFRCVTFGQADVTPDMIHDPFLAGVGWSWLMDALHSRGASFAEESGTITTTSSTPFGSKQEEPQQSQIEIRASWTPVLDQDHPLTTHLDAWQDLLGEIAGLPPDDDTVISLAARLASHR